MVEPDSYYAEGDLVYIQVRPQSDGGVRNEQHDWGLCDYDRESGELVGIEIWKASEVLPAELLAALPRLSRSGVSAARDGFAATG